MSIEGHALQPDAVSYIWSSASKRATQDLCTFCTLAFLIDILMVLLRRSLILASYRVTKSTLPDENDRRAKILSFSLIFTMASFTCTKDLRH